MNTAKDIIPANLPPAVLATLEETNARGNLHAYAAVAALRVLHQNWADALNDGSGHSLDQLIGDIDNLMGILVDHKVRLRARLELAGWKHATQLSPLPTAEMTGIAIFDDETPGEVVLYRTDGTRFSPCRTVSTEDRSHYDSVMSAWGQAHCPAPRRFLKPEA